VQTERISVRRRFRDITNYTGTEFLGRYKGCHVEVNREPKGLGYYIIVDAPDGGGLYDGWWREGEYRPIDDAIYEALYGSKLLERPAEHDLSRAASGEDD